jgi:hypothetical protein
VPSLIPFVHKPDSHISQLEGTIAFLTFALPHLTFAQAILMIAHIGIHKVLHLIGALQEHSHHQATFIEVVCMLGGAEVSTQDLNFVSDLAQLLVGVLVPADVSAEAPVIELINGLLIWPVSGFMGQYEMLTPWGNWLNEVGSGFVDGGVCIYVDQIGVIIGAHSVSVNCCSPPS